MEIRFIEKEEWNDCMNLCWKTFLVFEADEYGAEGVKNFFDFVSSPIVEEMFLAGDYKAIAAFNEENKPVGFIGCRNGNHISLLFVDKDYHHQGIATALLDNLLKELKKLNKTSATVNSSPYAVGFYHAVGFISLSEAQEKDGIIFTPMIINF